LRPANLSLVSLYSKRSPLVRLITSFSPHIVIRREPLADDIRVSASYYVVFSLLFSLCRRPIPTGSQAFSWFFRGPRNRLILVVSNGPLAPRRLRAQRWTVETIPFTRLLYFPPSFVVVLSRCSSSTFLSFLVASPLDRASIKLNV